MEMDQTLTKVIVCPECRGTLVGWAEKSSLSCDACGREYPLVGGIPILLIEEDNVPASRPDHDMEECR